jgi:hypothetical protein
VKKGEPLAINHIGHGNKRKIQSIRFSCGRVYGRRSCGAFTAANGIGTDNKIPVCIKGFARTDHVIPPA